MRNPSVLFEDNHLLVLTKPHGWLVQRDQTGDHTLTDWARGYLKKKFNKPGNVFCHPVHRLDRPVGGVIVFARTSKALERMNKKFRDHEVEKAYLAEVEGRPEFMENQLVHWLDKDTNKNVVKAYDQPKGKAKRAFLTYQVLASFGSNSLLLIKPKTGRPHQIRVQMKKLGCPIRGDVKYGYTKANPDNNIQLFAFKITFDHPVGGKQLVFRSKPEWSDYQEFIDELD